MDKRHKREPLNHDGFGGGGGFSKNMGHMREGAGGGCRNKSTFERVVLSWGAQVPGENHTSEIVTRYWLTPRWGFA